MINPFLLTPKNRLENWKSLRGLLPTLSEQEQLKKVACYWAQAPLSKFAYDPERPDTWPTPWEMIYEGDWCKMSVAIGMEFTLRLSGWAPDRLNLVLIKDYDRSDLFFILKIDDKFVLNYDYEKVSEYPDTNHEVITTIGFDNKKYSERK